MDDNRDYVLCLGEALIDIVEHPDGSVEHVGGSPLNVACGLANLGHPTRFASWWGRDARGERIAAHAAGHGVDVVAGSDGATRTPTALAMLDEAGRATYRFDLEWDLPPLIATDRVRHVHTGSIAATLQPGADAVRDVLQRLQPQATVSYDPNSRPAIMGTPDQVLDRIEYLVSLADLVKGSDEDVTWLYPGLTLDQIARHWLGLGPALMVITRGADGAMAWLTGEPEPVVIPAPRVAVGDTVGAGDSFMCGMMSALFDAGLLGGAGARTRLRAARAADLRPAFDRAAACAAFTVSRAGSYSPSRADLAAR